MSDKFSSFIFRTRGIYMFVALAVAMGVKFYGGGTTSLPFFIVGLMVVVIVQILRMYAASYLWGRQAVINVEADFLCITGPYAYVRNPLYLGNFFIGLGLCIAINEWYAYALFTISYTFVYSIVIPYEERFLQEKFGDAYLKYKAYSRRLLPRLDGYKGSGVTIVPDYRVGILGEIHVPVLLALIFTAIYLLFVK